MSSFTTFLDALDADLRRYQIDFRRVFVLKLNLPKHCANYFFDILADTSRLYSDHLQLRRFEPSFHKTIFGGEGHGIPSKPSRDSIQGCLIRERFGRKIESLPRWSDFSPNNEYYEENGLRTLVDYTNQLILHLPEIYGESLNLREFVKGLLGHGRAAVPLEVLSVGLEHAAHHASYCRHTLEILSNEMSWWTADFERNLGTGPVIGTTWKEVELSPSKRLAAFARHFGISRKTASEWVKRYGLDAQAELRDRTRRPRVVTKKKTARRAK
ncbi:MAG: helix-turn-helix domain-containing protein [Bryobacteraceae bacterium]